MIRAAGFLLLSCAAAHAGFTSPSTPTYRDTARAEFAGWESFVSSVGGANPPDDPGTTPGASFDVVQLAPGAILPGGNLYSFVSPTSFVLTHSPASGQVSPDLAKLTLQVSTLGNELDYSSVVLTYMDAAGFTRTLAYDAYTELSRFDIGFGDQVESEFTWDLCGIQDAIADYTVEFWSAESHMSLDALFVDALWSDEPFTYCGAQVNSQGCTPAIGWSGAPSASSRSGFLVTASGLVPGQTGLLFYGTSEGWAAPFRGSGRCFSGPLRRTPVQDSGGLGACTGGFSFDFNARIAAGLDPALRACTTVRAQYWSRDPGAPQGVNLTDAIEFVIRP